MAKIHLSFPRDLMGVLDLPYVAAGYNIADTGAKLKTNVHLFYELDRFNRFAIAFLSRREFNAIRSSPIASSAPSTFFKENSFRERIFLRCMFIGGLVVGVLDIIFPFI